MAATGGPDPGDARIDDGPGELGVLGEEAVAGVHGLGTRPADRVEHRLDVEVGLDALDELLIDVRSIGVEIRVDHDRVDAEPLAGASHPERYLPTVGDQDGVEHRHPAHIRKTP